MCFLLRFTFLIPRIWKWLVDFKKNVFIPSIGYRLDKEIKYNL